MDMKPNIMFFPGKNMPLKRYTSYFRRINLILSDPLNTNVFLSHSRGIVDAIEYCINNNINPTIISMDGIELKSKPKNLPVISFRPLHKQHIGDEYMYKTNLSYSAKQTHHPYMDKKTRDLIENVIIDFYYKNEQEL